MKYEDYKNDITITGFSMEDVYDGDNLATAKLNPKAAIKISYKAEGELQKAQSLLNPTFFGLRKDEITVPTPDVKATEIVNLLQRLVFDYIYDQLLKNLIWHLEEVKKLDVYLKSKPVGEMTA